eukprot:gene14920-biopygen9679
MCARTVHAHVCVGWRARRPLVPPVPRCQHRRMLGARCRRRRATPPRRRRRPTLVAAHSLHRYAATLWQIMPGRNFPTCCSCKSSACNLFGSAVPCITGHSGGDISVRRHTNTGHVRATIP